MFGELPTDRASLFGPQVQRLILLPLKKEEKENKWLEKRSLSPPKGRGKKSKSLFPYGFGTLHKVHSNSMLLQAT